MRNPFFMLGKRLNVSGRIRRRDIYKKQRRMRSICIINVRMKRKGTGEVPNRLKIFQTVKMVGGPTSRAD